MSNIRDTGKPRKGLSSTRRLLHISLPKELKEKMIEKGGDTNWSEVAKLAFERHLSGYNTESLLEEAQREVLRLKNALIAASLKFLEAGTGYPVKPSGANNGEKKG
jgi:hypothetical protein